MAIVRSVSIHDDVKILGHVFHGLDDIKSHVEMSLYDEHFSCGDPQSCEPKSECMVHVGELWQRYPCFDSEDYMYENRSYQNYIFRFHKITKFNMRMLAYLPGWYNCKRVSWLLPWWYLPMVYYEGDGDTMLVATSLPGLIRDLI